MSQGDSTTMETKRKSQYFAVVPMKNGERQLVAILACRSSKFRPISPEDFDPDKHVTILELRRPTTVMHPSIVDQDKLQSFLGSLCKNSGHRRRKLRKRIQKKYYRLTPSAEPISDYEKDAIELVSKQTASTASTDSWVNALSDIVGKFVFGFVTYQAFICFRSMWSDDGGRDPK